MQFMLDTNICIYIIKHRPASVLERFRQYDLNQFCLSMVSYAEFHFGALKSQHTEHNLQQLQRLTSQIKILPWAHEAAHQYGDIRRHLEQYGTKIGSNDTMIAGHALSLGCVLVTNNVREFERVPELKVESWVS